MAGRTRAGHARRMPRVLAALAIALGAAGGIGACSPITTHGNYSPSDGSHAELGDELSVANLLVLTTAQGEPALVVGGLTNHASEATTVTLVFGDADPVTVPVGPVSTVLLDPLNEDGVTLVLPTSPVAPGANIPVTISTPTGGSTQINVVALDGTLEPYDQYLEAL